MSTEKHKILTTDGIPLEESLKKAERKNKIKAMLLVAPLLLFIIINRDHTIFSFLLSASIAAHQFHFYMLIENLVLKLEFLFELRHYIFLHFLLVVLGN